MKWSSVCREARSQVCSREWEPKLQNRLLLASCAVADHQKESWMRKRKVYMRSLLAKLCCFSLILAALLACRLTSNSDDKSSTRSGKDGPNVELCKKYESCGCQSYDECIAQAEKSEDLNKPGVRECMLKSSCDSLCAGKPDGCGGNSGSKGSTMPERSNCAAISCSRDSDCPSDCYGGCNGVICLSF